MLFLKCFPLFLSNLRILNEFLRIDIDIFYLLFQWLTSHFLIILSLIEILILIVAVTMSKYLWIVFCRWLPRLSNDIYFGLSNTFAGSLTSYLTIVLRQVSSFFIHCLLQRLLIYVFSFLFYFCVWWWQVVFVVFLELMLLLCFSVDWKRLDLLGVCVFHLLVIFCPDLAITSWVYCSLWLRGSGVIWTIC